MQSKNTKMDNIKQQKYPQGRIVPFPPTLEEQELVKEGRILIECAKWFGKDDVWLFGNAGPNRIASWNGIGVENGRVVRVDWYDEVRREERSDDRILLHHNN